ncbi:MAG: hypothetical protein HYX38_21100 [Rhodospirillales bacterium]|nr:hypothetical protein [Rhodospirillales bacterium]
MHAAFAGDLYHAIMKKPLIGAFDLNQSNRNRQPDEPPKGSRSQRTM